MELLTRIHLPNKRLFGQKDTLRRKRFQIELELNTFVDAKKIFEFLLGKTAKVSYPKNTVAQNFTLV